MVELFFENLASLYRDPWANYVEPDFGHKKTEGFESLGVISG